MGWISAKKLLSEYPQPKLFQLFESEQFFEKEKMPKTEIHNYSEPADAYLKGATGVQIQKVPIEVQRMSFTDKYSLSWEIHKMKLFREKMEK